jgi:DDB1- and CUL4-associated factor 6
MSAYFEEASVITLQNRQRLSISTVIEPGLMTLISSMSWVVIRAVSMLSSRLVIHPPREHLHLTAPSWSKSGRFLASGSDDTYLNIWSYNPDSLAQPFSLNTSVSTGHGANIFGVKFAPHSNDRTVITCAGDSQVRVFDIEYGGNYDNSSRDAGLDSTRSRRFQNFFNNARYLHDGNTNARVYKSHSNRVKRIVTESSPYTFLTCSEDGEVRQWDLRQPSSAYPAPRGGQGFMRYGRPHDDDNVPPPLISYKKFSLDLNSISCSANQPYYIVLGGTHLHAFLHDRRMLGRDVTAERGQSPGSSPGVGSHDEIVMDQATRCVKRFAPNRKFAMGIHDNGHITACKISDANPNELIASWSGDHIYSFDIVQSPDVRDVAMEQERTLRASHAARHQKHSKRKRTKAASSTNLTGPAKARTRSGRGVQTREEEAALRVRYGNGQSQNLSTNSAHEDLVTARSAADILLSEAQKLSLRIAKSLVQLRKSVFDFEASIQDQRIEASSSERTPYSAVFTTVLGQAATLLPQIDEVIRDWSYPLNPSPEEVVLQNTLRRNRQASRRFVQAAGCLAATMGGHLQTLSQIPDPRMALFNRIEPAQREGTAIDHDQRFCYDFLKTILLGLSSNRDALLEAFRQEPDQFRDSQRFPLGPDDGQEAIHNKLRPYLLELARSDKPIINIDANRFETEESRNIFRSQIAAVNAFFSALKDSAVSSGNSDGISQQSESAAASERLKSGAACRFWGIKVGRSLLMEAGEGINYEFVKRAFGGLRGFVIEDTTSDAEEVDAANEIVEPIGAAPRESANEDTHMIEPSEEVGEDGNAEEGADDDDDDDDMGYSSASEYEDGEDDDAEDEDGLSRSLYRRAIGFGGSRERAKVEFDKPYSSHTRIYKGHCNVKTVKDVNFYGLNDEYVVSGSDSGHVFIWDRKSTQLVNILEGDGEVVNVITGHPYEPMIAASGIDSTVKIFSPDARLQEDAKKGIDVANPFDAVPTHSSLRVGGPRRRPTQPADNATATPPRGLTSRKAMHKSYEITTQNDVSRREGIGEAYITVSDNAHAP